MNGNSPFPPSEPQPMAPPPPSPVPETQPKVPPPPQEIGIRTMQGDVKSMQETGGAAPAPQPFAAPLVSPEEKLTIPGYTGPEEAVFTPETLPQGEARLQMQEEKKKGRGKTIAIVLGILVLATGLGALGYYFIYPLLFAPVPQTEETLPPPSPSPEPPPTTPESLPEILSHQTLFSPAVQTVEKILTPALITQITLQDAISASAQDKLAAGSLKEIYFADANENVLPFSTFLKGIFPDIELSAEDLNNLFQEDFTGFVYYDGTNAWPGVVAKIRAGVNDVLAKSVMASALEKLSTTLKNIYTTDPGAPSEQGFKDGQVLQRPGRYLSFSLQGASFNYVWLNGYLLLSTNYQGAQEAAGRVPVSATPLTQPE